MIHWAWIIVALLIGCAIGFVFCCFGATETIRKKYDEGYQKGYLDRSMKELKKRQEDE